MPTTARTLLLVGALALGCCSATETKYYTELTYRKVNVGPVDLNVALAGPALAVNKVLLLHGFPEGSHMWSLLVTALQDTLEYPETYQFIMPDMRGYNRSDAPEDEAQYHVYHLVQDSANLLRRLSPGKRAHVIGHDWGAIVGWSLAATHPHMLRSFTAINANHPRGWVEAMRGGKLQSVMSQYVLMFLSDQHFAGMFTQQRHAAVGQEAAAAAAQGTGEEAAAQTAMLSSVLEEMLADSYKHPKTGKRAGKKGLRNFWEMETNRMGLETRRSWARGSVRHGLQYYRANFKSAAPKGCFKYDCFTKHAFTSSFDQMPPLVDTRVLVLWGDIDATFDTKGSLRYMKRSINAPMGLEVKRFRDGTHWVTYEPHQQRKMAKAIGKFWGGEQDVENGGRGMRVGMAQPVQGNWLAHEPSELALGDEDREDPESPEDAAERAESAGRGTSAAPGADERDEL